MSIKRYPPAFNDEKKYPPQYNLDSIDVYLEASIGEYFNVNGLPSEIGFGKHAFNIFVTEPDNGLKLKNYGNILIEAKDANGTLIYSGITQHSDISGGVICFIWIKQDPLRTEKNIIDGQGTLTIVGQLDNVPNQYRDVYNLRTTIPLNIRKSFSNVSPILFESSSKISDSLIISEQLEADIDNANFNRSYADITIKDLNTFSGEVEKIQISYLESGSLSALTDDDFTFLTQHTIQKTSASFEDEIDFRIADGLNPISQSFRVLMPPMANQSGSDFGLADNKFKFKFDFLNKNNEKAKSVVTNTDLEITSSFINFAGPATVITGEDNLVAGQLFVGSSLSGAGMEFNGGSSAFLRSIGYLGFTSASAGSGSGFMLYSGSVLGANTDDYSSGGVGFEFVQDSSSFMRFGTADSLFDIRAKKFFVGSEDTQFVSGSGNNIEISSSGFHLKPDGSVTMSGQLAVEAGGTIGGFTISNDALSTTSFKLSSSQDLNDSVSFISSSNFKVGAGGQVTASNILLSGALITGSTDIDVANDIRVRGTKIAQFSSDDTNIILGDSNAILTASSAQINTLTSPKIIATELSSSTSVISSSVAISASKIIGVAGAFFGGDVDVVGNVTATTFTTQEITTNTSAGSTIFGDTGDDTHIFTGSVSIHATASNIGLFLTGSELIVDNNISASGNVNVDTQLNVKGLAEFSSDIILANNKPFSIKNTSSTNVQLLKIDANDDFSLGNGTIENFLIQGGGAANQFILISGSGHIGIGKVTPQQALDVSGKILTDDSVMTPKIQAAGGAGLGLVDDSGTLGQGIHIEDGGQVGIRTTSPQTFLDVSGSNPEIALTGPANNTGSLVFGDDAFYKAGRIEYMHGTNEFVFKNASTERMRLAGTGLGIGALPATGQRLTVEGKISASGDFKVTDGTSTMLYDVSQHELSFNGGDLDITSKAFNTRFTANTDGNSTTANAFTFTTGSSAVPLMVMRTDGNIGIGTSSPHTELDLVGTASFGDTTDGLMIYRRGNVGYIEGIDKDRSGFNAIQIAANGSMNAPNLHLDTGGKVGVGKSGPNFKLDVAGDIASSGNITSPSFTSGFAGSGFKIAIDDDSKYTFTVDNLTVRDKMSVFELLIHQIRATNGSLFVSNTGRIISSSIVDASDKKFNLFFDTGSGYGHSFRAGDLIRAQRFTPAASGDDDGSTDGIASFKSDLHILSVNGTTSSIAVLTGSMDTDAPQEGYEYVRIGSTSTPDRQGSIYLTADDDNAPFIDVVDELTAHSQFNTTGKTKVRLGKLSGVGSTAFGTLSGYGLYASGSAFLEGGINADRGSIGGWGLSNSVISSSNITLDSTNQKITIQDTTFGNAGVQLEFAGSKGKFYAGDGSNKFIKFDGTRATIKSDNFELDNSGNITATNADLSGKLTSTEGQIGGFAIGSTALTSSNFTLSASSATNELFISHSNFKVRNSGQVTGSALLLTASSGANSNFLQFKDGTLTVRGDVAASSLSTTNFSVDDNGNLTAVSGSIGGFEITDTFISGGLTTISSSGEINVGTLQGVGDINGTNTGFQVNKNGEVLIKQGGANSNYIRFDNGFLDINTTTASLSGSSVKIGAPRFLLGEATNFISGANGNLKIVTGDATLSGSSVDILTPNFFFGSDLNFISGSSGGIKLVSEEVTLSGSKVDIKTPTFFLGNSNAPVEGHQFISGANGNIEISASGFHLNNGNIVANNADLSGKLTSTEGSIGGFSIDATTISSSTGTLILNNAGQITASAVSMSGTIVTDDITAEGGTIGGFTITDSVLSIDNIKLSSIEKGLVISSSDGFGRVLISSGSLSSTIGSTTNFFVDPSFESLSSDFIIQGGASGNANVGSWYFENDSRGVAGSQEELWNSGSVSMSISDSNAGDGSKHIRINVSRELGPEGTLAIE